MATAVVALIALILLLIVIVPFVIWVVALCILVATLAGLGFVVYMRYSGQDLKRSMIVKLSNVVLDASMDKITFIAEASSQDSSSVNIVQNNWMPKEVRNRDLGAPINLMKQATDAKDDSIDESSKWPLKVAGTTNLNLLQEAQVYDSSMRVVSNEVLPRLEHQGSRDTDYIDNSSMGSQKMTIASFNQMRLGSKSETQIELPVLNQQTSKHPLIPEVEHESPSPKAGA